MTTPPSKLSPERCHQLRENGILQLMVQLLHEHTFESHYQPEENTNIESFLENFNRKSGQRQRLSLEIRTIIENTSKGDYELEVLGLLEALRGYTECLYRFMTDVPESKPEVVSPIEAILELKDLMRCARKIDEPLRKEKGNPLGSEEKRCSFVELLGGFYVILDLLRAQRRFYAKFQDEVVYIDNSYFRCKYAPNPTAAYLTCVYKSEIELLKYYREPKEVRGVHYRLLKTSMMVLFFFPNRSDSRGIIGHLTSQGFLGNSLSFNQLLLSLIEGAMDRCHKGISYSTLVYLCCSLIYKTTQSFRRYSYAVNCGAIRIMTQLAMNIQSIEVHTGMRAYTISCILKNLDNFLEGDRGNVTEFLWIDGSIEMVIDVLAKSNGIEPEAVKILEHVNAFFLSTSPGILPATRRLWAIYESRDIAVVLLSNLRRLTDSNFFLDTRNLLNLFGNVLRSRDQTRKLLEVNDAMEVIAKFQKFTDQINVATAVAIIIPLMVFKNDHRIIDE